MVTELIVAFVFSITFLFIGLSLGYYIYSDKRTGEAVTPTKIVRDTLGRMKPITFDRVGIVRPISAEEQRKKGTPQGEEEDAMRETLSKIIEREKKDFSDRIL